ncbi:MAG: winged helix-turn-helix transcriptional regulator [Candidatus Kuenenia sp.]|nr:winged helix-turn-helix transcriptional regulator [Candidatus Kuenenia hertensis]
MAITKFNEFKTKEKMIAQICKALAHPARVAIVNFLIKEKECICREVVKELPLSQSTVSQHLKELKNAGLIKGEIDGPRVCYCIDSEKWTEVKKHMHLFFSQEVEETRKTC